MELHPTICNICNKETVIYTSNSIIYGKEYGSGKCYYCTNCKSYVGTHKPRPDEALGLLATKEMREMKMKCHDLFDATWKNEKDKKKARNNSYARLAKELDIPVKECHFGWFDMDMLTKAYNTLMTWTWDW